MVYYLYYLLLLGFQHISCDNLIVMTGIGFCENRDLVDISVYRTNNVVHSSCKV